MNRPRPPHQRGRSSRGANSRIDFGAVAREAITALPPVLARVLPGGRVVGREYVVLNPRRTDHHLGSFKVRLVGERASGPTLPPALGAGTSSAWSPI